MAIQLEGHPDNATAALYGGLVIVVEHEKCNWLVRRFDLPIPAGVVVLPEIDLPTHAARKALPAQVEMKDAVFNIGRAVLVVEALQQGDLKLLEEVMDDRLHQPYRLPLIPGGVEAMHAARQAGAAAAISGAGPSVIAFTPGDPAPVGRVMMAAFQQNGIKARAFSAADFKPGSRGRALKGGYFCGGKSMEGQIQVVGQNMVWHCQQETVIIQPWGLDGVRVQSTLFDQMQNLPHALVVEPLPAYATKIALTGEGAILQNGKVQVELDKDGRLSFFNARSGELLLAERPDHFTLPPARRWRPNRGGAYHLEVSFLPFEDEHFYGMGQHQHGRLDNKGCVIELEQRNTEVSIPFLVSSRGYGFLWNNPAIGRAELGNNLTRWVAESTRQMDYYLVVGDTPADLLERYAEVTGYAPMLPEWAAGFWQCKLRYKTQDELLGVAREYKRRGLPLAVIVIDYFHWTMLGEWKFDPACWPDPTAMVKELEEMGVKLMVSVWPAVNIYSENYQKMSALGYLARSELGSQVQMFLYDTYPGRDAPLTFYDATHPGGAPLPVGAGQRKLL